jgi:glycosyltransferase involved in cell wall biosynthesis
LYLLEELKDLRKVTLWSQYKVSWSEDKVGSEIAEKYPVRQIIPERFEFPRTGTIVFVGPHFIGPWVRYTYPRRIILILNSNIRPEEFRQMLWQLSNKGRRKVEIVYASELTNRLTTPEFTKKSVNYTGIVEPSLIDIDRFVPATSKPFDLASANYFTVGRLSRNAPQKHHPDDPAFYRRLTDYGCQVRIMGASRDQEAELAGLESVEVLPVFAQEAHLFLQGLDCFFYRTSEEWPEPWGRVVTEAMACGLPVVCYNNGGYVEIIDHGRNGFLFDTQQEALEILLRLKEDRALRESIGRAARETVEELFSPARRAQIVEFYLR